MYRLGLHLTLRSGREALTRLVVTAVAVAIGVAIMLAVLADFNAFKTTNNRPYWEGTQGQALSRGYQSQRNAELWSYGNDVYQGQTIERLDVAGLGPGAPLPPGISKLPASGEYYASPALAALIRSAPADELGDRFAGKLAGTIGQQALTGPDELVAYVGYSPQQLAARPSTTLVTTIANGTAKQVWTSYFRDAFVVGAIAFLFPILILVGTATRLAAARREERYAALRLVGATSRQLAIISSVDAVASALLGAVLGIGLFAAFQPLLADTAITSARYFADEVTPTTAGYLLVLIGVPVAAAISSLLSLRRVRISPLGVSRRVTPRAPGAWRMTFLIAGVVLFALGIAATSSKRIGPMIFPGLLLTMVGLVIGGPWLTAQAARLLRRLGNGPAPLLAARRLDDNPRAAFRAVSGLVLAVFLGTVVGGILPAVEYTTANPRATALRNVLLDGFTASPVCGNNVNCTGGGNPAPANPLAQPAGQQGLIAANGLPPQQSAALLAGLRAIPGATPLPMYTLKDAGQQSVHVKPGASGSGPGNSGPGTGGSGGKGGGSGTGGSGINGGGPGGPASDSVMSCTALQQVAVLGQCAHGRAAIEVAAQNLFGDNPQYSTQPIAGPSSPAVSANFSGLYLQALLVKVNSQATLEKVRTYLDTHTADSPAGMAARTFGEAVQARSMVASTVERLIFTAVTLTIIVAGCSLAVTTGGSLVERKRPFTLLRVSGTGMGTLYRVVLLEALLPLAAATVVAGGIAYVFSALTVGAISPAGTSIPVPGSAYFLTMGLGLVAALAIIGTSLPLLRRVTGPGSVRFE
jgi:hypothetical protein